MSKKKEKYYVKRFSIPSLKLDFDLMTNEESKEQLDLFLNLMLSLWYEKGNGEELKVYDFIGELKAKNHAKETIKLKHE